MKKLILIIAFLSLAGTALAITGKIKVNSLGTGKVVKINSSQNTKLTNGLVGLWSFDGSDMYGTTAIDRSGQGNNGTLVNSPTKVKGKTGQALSLNGSSQYVSVAGSQTFSSSFTVSFWAKPSSNPGSYRAFCISRNTGDDYSEGFVIDMGQNSTASWSWIGVEGAGMGTNTNLLNTSFPFNTWHHIVVDFSIGTNTVKLYADGALQKTRSRSSGTISAQKIQMGARYYGGLSGYFPGVIDDVRIYNRALSASEVTQLYKLGTNVINSR